jgi:hypothetical protein
VDFYMICSFLARRSRFIGISVLALATTLAAAPASALTIIPTFGATGGAAPFSFAEQACINSVISLYQSTFNDPITVNITFNNMNTGLGQSSTGFFSDTYANIHARLIADGTSGDDVTGLLKLGAAPPVSDSTQVALSNANGKALGYTGFSGADSVIGLRAGICFSVHDAATAAANPTKYDLFGVACHELDEALGTVSFVGGSTMTTADLYRYDGTAAGVLSGARSFTTSTSVHSFFSIDGVTALDEYNQFGRTGGDWGDWIVHNPSQVQDYAGTPGKLNDPNVELRLLDVVGYNRAAVPEPGSFAVLGLGLAAIIRLRRKNA